MIDPGSVFHTIQSAVEADGSITARWQVPADLPYFNGHFPGSPIFPAVGIVDATLQTLRDQLKQPSLHLAGIPSAKFMSPVVPDQRILLQLRRMNTASDEWQADWKDEDSLKLLASLRLICRS